ncbi:hypothetical protein [Xenorhabdus bovienii]|uniref:Uncharacterized protein n=1 Tax=Xenorhabdus bovienii str. kraussei Becker Underwood TaxID=1398204 RepID=A0A077PRR2_XENBV|nr:hypothetical protein [Xenorhabdus bovienii]CDH22559.1 conserved hypothetical protein [Xenorhabdus bovienii str. kraussei Becker Underwood]
MNFDQLAYPELIIIDGVEYKGSRKNNTVKIPYTDEPDVGIGRVITQKSGKRFIELKVLDVSFLPDGSLQVATAHPHILTMEVENMTASEHKSKNHNSVVNIGNISGHQIQVGNNNSQITNINIQELVEKIAKSDDAEAKNTLIKFLENNTVANIIGAGVAGLISLL